MKSVIYFVQSLAEHDALASPSLNRAPTQVGVHKAEDLDTLVSTSSNFRAQTVHLGTHWHWAVVGDFVASFNPEPVELRVAE